MSQIEIECVSCGRIFTGPSSLEPGDKFMCILCVDMGPETEFNADFPHEYQKMTVKSEEGTESIYVPVMSELIGANENEAELAANVVGDIGGILEIDLEEYGDLLQEVLEAAIVASRETVLEMVASVVDSDTYAKIVELVRNGEPSDG